MDLNKEIIKYYNDTNWDYKHVWDNSEFPALHFGIYDQNANNHKDALQNTNHHLAHLAGIKKGDYILDAGCGRGGSLFWLNKHLKIKGVGIGLVPHQIDECKRLASEKSCDEDIRFYVEDYNKTSLADGQFDVVWSCESLCHSSDKRKFYKEAFRLLKPGGRLIIADYIREKRPFNNSEESLLSHWFENWAIPDIDTLDEHRNHALHARFDEFVAFDYTDKVQVSLRNLNQQSKRWKWLGFILDKLNFRKPYQYKNQKASIAQFKAYKKGLWTYQLLKATKSKNAKA